MGGRKFFVTVGAVFLVVVMSLPAYAGIYSGQVTTPPTNDYNIDAGTNVTLNYDVDLQTFNMQFHTGAAPGSLLDAHFNEMDVSGTLVMYSEPGPGDRLSNLEFTTHNYNSISGPLGTLIIAAGNPLSLGTGSLSEIGYTLGTIDWTISGTLNYTAVPIPGTIWFLGSGLIGLAGLRRRFRTSE